MQDELARVNIAEEQRFYNTLSKMCEALLRTYPIDERGERKSLKDQVNLMKRQGLDMVHQHMREEGRDNRF